MENSARPTVVILSSEPWGKMLLSKMHYALELVKRGSRVFFVNPPRPLPESGLARVSEQQEDGNLVIIDTNIIRGSLFLRHKLFFLYQLLINRRYIGAIQKIVGSKIDEVWSFNPNLYTDLRSFRADKSILLLYDFYRGKHIVRAAEKADALISVSQVILDHYKNTPRPKLLVQHGLGHYFADKSFERLQKEDFSTPAGNKVKIGYTGNLLRAGMNTGVARQIIGSHPEIEFHFWGPHSMKDNNVNSVGEAIPAELLSFVDFLQQQDNVFLHGVVDQRDLSEGLFKMDAFLFIYSPKKEMNGASNAHKLLEYISTGKTIIATHVSNYAGTDLLVMSEREEENRLPEIFDGVIKDLPLHNSKEKQIQRINFALDNTYSRQIERVQQFIAG